MPLPLQSFKGKNPLNWNALKTEDFNVRFGGANELDGAGELEGRSLFPAAGRFLQTWNEKQLSFDVKLEANCGKFDIMPGCAGLLIGEVFWVGSNLYTNKRDGILIKRFTVEVERPGHVTFSTAIQPFENRHVFLDAMMSLISPVDSGKRSIRVEFHAPDEATRNLYKFVSMSEFDIWVQYATDALRVDYKQSFDDDNKDKNTKLHELQDAIRAKHVTVQAAFLPRSHSGGTLVPKSVDSATLVQRNDLLSKRLAADADAIPQLTPVVSLLPFVMSDLKRQLDAANVSWTQQTPQSLPS